MSYQEILYEVSDRIATITLNRPDKLNAWTGQMGREVRNAMTAANDDEDVRVIVFTGAGKGFWLSDERRQPRAVRRLQRRNDHARSGR